VAPPPVIPVGDRQVEKRPLPPDPVDAPLPEGIPPEEFPPEALEEGSCTTGAGKPTTGAPTPCPDKSGILISEAKAARLKMYTTSYKELRLLYEADRAVWEVQREYYEARLALADDRLKELEPTWFQQNQLALGVAGGFLLGAALTLSLVAILDESNGSANEKDSLPGNEPRAALP
jgi:hypothetical protein